MIKVKCNVAAHIFGLLSWAGLRPALSVTTRQIQNDAWRTTKAFLRYLGPTEQDQKREMYGGKLQSNNFT